MYYLSGGDERVLHVPRSGFLLTYCVVEDHLEVLVLLSSFLRSRMGTSMYRPDTNL